MRLFSRNAFGFHLALAGVISVFILLALSTVGALEHYGVLTATARSPFSSGAASDSYARFSKNGGLQLKDVAAEDGHAYSKASYKVEGFGVKKKDSPLQFFQRPTEEAQASSELDIQASQPWAVTRYFGSSINKNTQRQSRMQRFRRHTIGKSCSAR